MLDQSVGNGDELIDELMGYVLEADNAVRQIPAESLLLIRNMKHHREQREAIADIDHWYVGSLRGGNDDDDDGEPPLPQSLSSTLMPGRSPAASSAALLRHHMATLMTAEDQSKKSADNEDDEVERALSVLRRSAIAVGRFLQAASDEVGPDDDGNDDGPAQKQKEEGKAKEENKELLQQSGTDVYKEVQQQKSRKSTPPQRNSTARVEYDDDGTPLGETVARRLQWEQKQARGKIEKAADDAMRTVLQQLPRWLVDSYVSAVETVKALWKIRRDIEGCQIAAGQFCESIRYEEKLARGLIYRSFQETLAHWMSPLRNHSMAVESEEGAEEDKVQPQQPMGRAPPAAEDEPPAKAEEAPPVQADAPPDDPTPPPVLDEDSKDNAKAADSPAADAELPPPPNNTPQPQPAAKVYKLSKTRNTPRKAAGPPSRRTSSSALKATPPAVKRVEDWTSTAEDPPGIRVHASSQSKVLLTCSTATQTDELSSPPRLSDDAPSPIPHPLSKSPSPQRKAPAHQQLVEDLHDVELTIVECTNLLDRGLLGKSDSFVAVSNHEGREVFRTPIVKNSVNPSWGALEATVKLRVPQPSSSSSSPSDDEAISIRLSVWHQKFLEYLSFLGQVRISVKELFSEASHWPQTLQLQPRIKENDELVMQNKEKLGSITVRVAIPPPGGGESAPPPLQSTTTDHSPSAAEPAAAAAEGEKKEEEAVAVVVTQQPVAPAEAATTTPAPRPAPKEAAQSKEPQHGALPTPEAKRPQQAQEEVKQPQPQEAQKAQPEVQPTVQQQEPEPPRAARKACGPVHRQQSEEPQPQRQPELLPAAPIAPRKALPTVLEEPHQQSASSSSSKLRKNLQLTQNEIDRSIQRVIKLARSSSNSISVLYLGAVAPNIDHPGLISICNTLLDHQRQSLFLFSIEDCTQIGDSSLPALHNFISLLPNLQIFSFDESAFSEVAVAALRELSSSRCGRSINGNNKGIDVVSSPPPPSQQQQQSSSLEIISLLKEQVACGVEHIDCSGIALDDDAVVSVVEHVVLAAPANTIFQQLDFSDNRMTARGAKKLISLLSRPLPRGIEVVSIIIEGNSLVPVSLATQIAELSAAKTMEFEQASQ